MSQDSESSGPKAKAKAAVKKKTAVKKTTAKKAAAKKTAAATKVATKVAAKKAATKKRSPVKKAIAEDAASGTRAAIEAEAAVVHAAAMMQARYERQRRPQRAAVTPAADAEPAADSQPTGKPDPATTAPVVAEDPAPFASKSATPADDTSAPAAAAPEPSAAATAPAAAPEAESGRRAKSGGTAAPAASPPSDTGTATDPDKTASVNEPAARESPADSNRARGDDPKPAPSQGRDHTASGSPTNEGQTQGQVKGKGKQKWKERFKEKQKNRQKDRDQNGDHGGQAHQGQGQPQAQGQPQPLEPCAGMTEIAPKGFGFLRTADKNYVAGRQDVFVPPEFVRKYTLRDGMYLEGEARRGRRGPQMTTLTRINGGDPEKYANRPLFEELKAVNPDRRYLLETDKSRFTTRVIDMLAPIGRGQRGLIVAPPRTGKTTILEHIAQALEHNHPDVHVIILLIDERPEEVTQMKRLLTNAEIFSSSNDSNVKNHVRIAELAIERSKRLVEAGEHVVVLLDSITRLGRAFNNAMKGGGRTMSGGIDIRALELPRRLFAAARNTRDAGSLTIIATALVETGSKMDELIFQEFKGTGNMELVLDRKIAQQYVYPAVDIFRSGTRREELLLPDKHLDKIYRIRRGLSGHRPSEAIERLLQIMGRFNNNAQMLLEIPAT